MTSPSIRYISADIPGYDLFQYFDEDGIYQTVDSADVNDYIQTITGQPFTAKMFRTWAGSTAALKVDPWIFEDDEVAFSIEVCRLQQLKFEGEDAFLEVFGQAEIEIRKWKFKK